MKNKASHGNATGPVIKTPLQSEFRKTLSSLKPKAVSAHVISFKTGLYKAWNQVDWKDGFEINLAVDDLFNNTYDAWYCPM